MARNLTTVKKKAISSISALKVYEKDGYLAERKSLSKDQEATVENRRRKEHQETFSFTHLKHLFLGKVQLLNFEQRFCATSVN